MADSGSPSSRSRTCTVTSTAAITSPWRCNDAVTHDVQARGGGAAGPKRRRQEHDDQVPARVHRADQGRMRVLGLDVATSPLDIRARIGYMPENDAHIPGHQRRLVRRLLRRAGRAAARRRDAACARGALLRRPWRGALPQCRDLLDRDEAAHQAGAGARARSRPAVSRRAHQRHGPQRAATRCSSSSAIWRTTRAST